jgi:hypothetical protein
MHPAVTRVIPGAKRKAQVEENVRACELPPIPLDHLAKLEALFGRACDRSYIITGRRRRKPSLGHDEHMRSALGHAGARERAPSLEFQRARRRRFTERPVAKNYKAHQEFPLLRIRGWFRIAAALRKR